MMVKKSLDFFVVCTNDATVDYHAVSRTLNDSVTTTWLSGWYIVTFYYYHVKKAIRLHGLKSIKYFIWPPSFAVTRKKLHFHAPLYVENLHATITLNVTRQLNALRLNSRNRLNCVYLRKEGRRATSLRKCQKMLYVVRNSLKCDVCKIKYRCNTMLYLKVLLYRSEFVIDY